MNPLRKTLAAGIVLAVIGVGGYFVYDGYFRMVIQPDHWRYSSAGYYASNAEKIGEVPITCVRW